MQSTPNEPHPARTGDARGLAHRVYQPSHAQRAQGMQGVFDAEGALPMPSLSANWTESLDPDVDEATQRQMRAEHATAVRARQILAQRGGPHALAPPAPLRHPIPPPQRFTVKGMVMLVVKGADIPPRAGEWGHYIVPYVIEDAGTATPYTTHPPNPIPLVVAEGYPGMSRDGADVQPLPNVNTCALGVDFVKANPSKFWEVGLDNVKKILEEAEAADLEFARRMEGLGNVAKGAVWECLDPEYDASDRVSVMEQFMSKYLERFYAKVGTGNFPDIESISAEAMHKHKTFCKAWSDKHYRTLTPAVTAPAEALAGEFFPYIEPLMAGAPPHLRLSRMELARVFMRHPDIAGEFASALQHFSNSLEQTRGRRNANYKQINMMNSARVISYNRLGNLLDQKGPMLTQLLKKLCTEASSRLHPMTVDWYAILGQIPPVHRYFEDTTPYHGISASRQASAAQGQVPPWRFGKD